MFDLAKIGLGLNCGQNFGLMFSTIDVCDIARPPYTIQLANSRVELAD